MICKLRHDYYWPQMAADVAGTFHNWSVWANNFLILRKRRNALELFPSHEPLSYFCIYILDPQKDSWKENWFLRLKFDLFMKLMQAVPLKSNDALPVALPLVESWVFRYGIPVNVLCDNSSEFVSRFFKGVSQSICINNEFLSNYHWNTNDQTEIINRKILQVLRCYLLDHLKYWEVEVQVLTYQYITAIHPSTGFAQSECFYPGHQPHSKSRKRSRERKDSPRFEGLNITLHGAYVSERSGETMQGAG